MKKIRNLLLMVLILFILAGCGQSDKASSSAAENDDQNEMEEPLHVELLLPDSAKPGESLEIQAEVTQGDEPVDDAYEVVFEIWLDEDKENSEMVDYSDYADGLYSIEKVLEEPGVYHVQSHVTARGMHIMPVKQITIETDE